MSDCGANIRPTFNRLVAFRSTDFSYHGGVVQLEIRVESNRLQRSKLTYVAAAFKVSYFAFNFKLRPYTTGTRSP
jgi:hypothetical protein